jgi:hypothetical protein
MEVSISSRSVEAHCTMKMVLSARYNRVLSCASDKVCLQQKAPQFRHVTTLGVKRLFTR